MRAQVDFRRIADAALGQSVVLLGRWLPGGKVDGREFKALNPTRADSKVGSFSVNLDTGKWGDFATDDAGLDLISLYAYLHSLPQLEAAREVAAQMGMSVDDCKMDMQQTVKNKEDVGADVGADVRSGWIPLLPAPDDAGLPPVAHPVRGRPEMRWKYFSADGHLLGVVYRFKTSDGGKEVLPCVFAQHGKSNKREWRWMAFPEPRPLYGLDELAMYPDLPVLLVEGEKCAGAAHRFFKGEFVCVTWPGGVNAVDKADWSPLAGRVIYAWPDCDAKRVRLTKAEKESGADPESKPFLSEHDQPGTKGMLRACELIRAIDADTDFRMVQIPGPGAMPDGWDIDDELCAGDNISSVRQAIKDAKPLSWNTTKRPEKKPSSRRKKAENGEPDNPSVLDRFALIYSTETVFDIDKSLVMSVSAMRLALGKNCVEWWLQHEERRMILPDQLVFDPTGQCAPPAINLFRGIEMKPKPGEFGPIMELLHHLCAESSESDQGVMDVVMWVIKWLALPLQRPGTKMRSALVFHGPQGTGKNLFFEIVAAIYGRYSIVVGQEQLEEKHNDWCSSKLFMIGDEVIARGELYHQKNKLKSFITGETIQINPKFLPIRTERNHVNVVFLSNEDQPLALEETDRRYFVVYTPPSRKDDLYDRVAACVRNGGVEAFYEYLLSIKMEGFMEFSRPPMTVAKRDLINLGMKPEHRFVYEWIKGYLPIFLAPCTAGQFYRFYQYWAGLNGERIPPQKNFTESVKKFVGILTDRAGSEETLIVYKVVRLPDRGNGQSCERVWIPKGYMPPDGWHEGEWMMEAIDRFDGYFADYKAGRSCAN